MCDDRSVELTPVAIVWSDAHADVDRSWVPASEVQSEEPYLIISVGFLVSPGKKGHVTLAQSLDQEHNVDSLLHVPAGMVRQVVSLDSDMFPRHGDGEDEGSRLGDAKLFFAENRATGSGRRGRTRSSYSAYRQQGKRFSIKPLT